LLFAALTKIITADRSPTQNRASIAWVIVTIITFFNTLSKNTVTATSLLASRRASIRSDGITVIAFFNANLK